MGSREFRRQPTHDQNRSHRDVAPVTAVGVRSTESLSHDSHNRPELRESCTQPAPQLPLDPAYVAVVSAGTGHARRRVYLSLAAAEKAVRRAQAAGIPARVVLCELLPLAGDL